jgi:hypothetical protein
MSRIYEYEDYEYTDEEFTTEKVKAQLQESFPESTDATADEKEPDNGDTEIIFTVNAGTKAHLHYQQDDVPPMTDHELFLLEDEARYARKRRFMMEITGDTVLSLIGDSWYLRSILGDPQPIVENDNTPE